MKSQTIDISFRSILRVVLVVGVVMAAWHIRQFLLVLLTAVVVAAFVESGTRAFARLRIPRVWAIVFMYLIGLGILAAIVLGVIPVFIKEIQEFIDLFPARSAIGQALQPLDGILSTAGSAKDLVGATDPVRTLSTIWTQVSTVQSTGVASAIFSGFLDIILVFVLSFYIAMSNRGVDAFLRAVTPYEYENYVVGLWHRTEHKIGAWFRGQVLLAFIVATITYVGLLLFGVPYALLLALLTFIFEFIPFGILLAVIPSVLIALLGGGIGLAILVGAFYTVVQQIENYVLQPYIIRRVTGVPALVVLIAVIIGLPLAGIYGLFLAIPISVLLIELIQDRERLKRRDALAE